MGQINRGDMLELHVLQIAICVGFAKFFTEKMQKQLMTIISQGYGHFLMYQRITKDDYCKQQY